MYRLIFGTEKKYTLYIFRLVTGSTVSGKVYNIFLDKYLGFQNKPKFIDITGDSAAVHLRFDEEKADNYYPSSIVKTSLELGLIRTNESHYSDIIEGNDNEWWAVVTEKETFMDSRKVPFNEEYYPVFKNTTGDVSIAFKGKLTNETYSETYNHNSPISFIFHDRLGELNENKYVVNEPFIGLIDFLNEMLEGQPCEKRLHIEFPYDIQDEIVAGKTYSGLTSPNNIIIDVTRLHNKTKKDALLDVIKSFNLQLSNDYSKAFLTDDDYYELEDCGIFRVRMIAYITDISHTYYTFIKTSGVYVKGANETLSTIPKHMPNNYKVINRSGRYGLIRKANYIDAINEYELRENLFYPHKFDEEFFIPYEGFPVSAPYNPNDRYKYSCTFFTVFASLGIAYRLQEGTFLGYLASANAVGDSNKMGVLIRDDFESSIYWVLSKRALMFKGNNDIKVEIEAISNATTRNVFYSLIAFFPRTRAMLAFGLDGTYDWHVYTDGIPPQTPILQGGVAGQFEKNVYSRRADTVPQPPFATIQNGEFYYLCLYLSTGNTQGNADEFTYITDVKVSPLNTQGLPQSLRIRTNISDTMRSSISDTFKLHNQPLLGTELSYFNNGIYATGLTPSIKDIIAPQRFFLDYRNATLLVHLSDIIGSQMVEDRWMFQADVKQGVDIEKLVISNWSDYVCALVSSENTGIQRAIKLTVEKFISGVLSSSVVYSITSAFGAYSAINNTQFAELSEIDYLARLDAFIIYVKAQAEEQLINVQNNAYQENFKACPFLSKAYTIFLEASGSGMPGVLTQTPDSPHRVGKVVSIEANDNPPNGYFVRWEILSGASYLFHTNNYAFSYTMTAADVTFRAIFSD